MINKIKDKAMFYWMNHKICVIIIAVAVVALLIK